MASGDTALVKYDRENVQQFSRQFSDNRWLDEPSREANSLYNLTVKLTGILIAAGIFLGTSYLYIKIHHLFQNGQEYIITVPDTRIRSEPRIDDDTLIGKSEQGVRVRVIGTQIKGKRTWYEVEFTGQQPKISKPNTRKWIASENMTLTRE